jgi:RNA polymerase sigma-70 factor (ECF subfamily)
MKVGHAGGVESPRECECDRDRVLVSRARSGDLAAFDLLVRRYYPVVSRHVRSIVGSRSLDTDDITQEVFVRAYRFLGRFRGDSSFGSWLYRVTINVARSYYGRRLRQQRVWGDSGEGTESSVIDSCRHVDDIEHEYASRDLIDKALATLPEDLRRSIVLRDLHGLDYQEIAVATGVPLGTVESRLFRARRRLRPMLTPLLRRPSVTL